MFDFDYNHIMSTATFVVAFNSVYHTAVVLCTHLLIRKTILLIYFFT